ncbi:MAG: hypothetical protein AUK47_00880 [Deltaproteobacteria bacterium CG2_30_63_29]|nr:MAG: hypothetical protein AUK47_00880 [Deltaproteobacteria bacterium CG2_30_63_29]PJB36140.1 MAG: hypothetical protein CO108_24085 [Deltaproteobacteria bacterium CG_4_9_14_3_um_filter_63_12]
MKSLYKILIGVGVFVLLLGGGLGYLWWNDLTVGDFFKTPTEVLDETIYAAQQEDEALFKKGFSATSREEMDTIHKFNMNIPPEEFDPEIHWTWPTLMKRFEQEGGFDVLDEPSWYDRWTEDKAEVKIEFEGRTKMYPFVKEGMIWRIDLLNSDRGFQLARSCVRDPSGPMCK